MPFIQQNAARTLSNLAQNEITKQVIVTYINQNESLKEFIQANYSNLNTPYFLNKLFSLSYGQIKPQISSITLSQYWALAIPHKALKFSNF